MVGFFNQTDEIVPIGRLQSQLWKENEFLLSRNYRVTILYVIFYLIYYNIISNINPFSNIKVLWKVKIAGGN